MKWNRSLALGSLCLALAPLAAWAVPVKDSSCPQIHQIEGGPGAFYSEDCTRLYVLPPAAGTMTIDHYQPGPNLDLRCQRVHTIEDDQANMDLLDDSMSRQLRNYQEQVDKLQDDLSHGLTPRGLTVDQVNQRIDGLLDRMQKIRTQLATLLTSKNTERLALNAEEGGQARFVVAGTYSDFIQAYRRANPNLVVERMPIDQSFLSSNTVSLKDKGPAMTAVLELSLPGITQMPILPDLELMMNGKQAMSAKAPEGSLIFGDALSGGITLSLAGACAVQEGSGGGIKSYIRGNVSYGYQVQVRRDFKASLDLQELVRQIHEQTKRGGLFTSSTLNSFVDSRRSTEWVTFEDASQDERLQYTDDQIKDLKKEFLDRALTEIVSLKTGSSDAVVALIAPGPNGASTAADALSMCTNIYCQIGSAGFKVLNSIFGSESEVSDLTRQMEGRHEEQMTSKRMVLEYGTYSFQ